MLLGLYYLIVEECHGSLRQLVEQTGALPVNDVIAIAGQMLSGAPYHPPQRHSYSCSCWLTIFHLAHRVWTGLHHIHSHSVRATARNARPTADARGATLIDDPWVVRR